MAPRPSKAERAVAAGKAERGGPPRKPAAVVDYAIIGLLTLALVAVLLIFFRDQVATILAWITGLIG
jgi:hypothetical protein